MAFLVCHPIDGLFCFGWTVDLFKVLFHYFGMYRYFLLCILECSVKAPIIWGIMLKTDNLYLFFPLEILSNVINFNIYISHNNDDLIYVKSNTYSAVGWLCPAILFPFYIVKIDLFDERIIIVNTKLLKKGFPNLVDIANNNRRKKYLCQWNCHCVNRCNNLWKSND